MPRKLTAQDIKAFWPDAARAWAHYGRDAERFRYAPILPVDGGGILSADEPVEMTPICVIEYVVKYDPASGGRRRCVIGTVEGTDISAVVQREFKPRN